MPPLSQGRDFDVAILGTGVGGTILGSILARHHVKVLMLEQGCHPRFAIGESTIPETTVLLRLVSKRYDVPEIAYLSTFQDVRARVTSNCGVKRNFSFCYQRPGEPTQPDEITQLLTWAPPYGPDIHFFRQDIDAYMMTVAISYGAVVKQMTKMTGLEFDDDGVRLATDKGEEFRAKFVIDAGGIMAPVAHKLGLREVPSPLVTRSRSMYTHMLGVKPFDQVGPSRDAHGMRSPISQGTLHHLFKEGWMWIIPFNNHATATNPLVSVGINFNLNVSPPTGMPPEEEFWKFISQYPTVAAQFENATSVRPWVAADRLQFSSTRFTGPRYMLLPHAGGFVDPLFSSGLAITVSAVNNMAHRLITATRTGDYDPEKFEYVDTWIKKGFSYYDKLVSCSYISWSDFRLWSAWHRSWMLGSLYGVAGLIELLQRTEATGDPGVLEMFETKPYRGVQAFDMDEFSELFHSMATEVESVRDNVRSHEEAAGRIYELLGRSPLCPAPWNLATPQTRCPGSLTLPSAMRIFKWGNQEAPASIRENYFSTLPSRSLIRNMLHTQKELTNRLDGGTLRMARDAFFTWNKEWTRSFTRN